MSTEVKSKRDLDARLDGKRKQPLALAVDSNNTVMSLVWFSINLYSIWEPYYENPSK